MYRSGQGRGHVVGRLVGAVARAFLVVIVIAAPALLLPGTSQNARDISLIVGCLAGAFTMFEYGSTHPGLIDFRFAPPYNRGRFFTFTAIMLSLVFVCRATENADPFSRDFLDLVDRFVAVLDFPYSPIQLAETVYGPVGGEAFSQLIRRATTVALTVSVAGLVFFGLILWVFRWPTGRERFNLWINLPTFEPSSGRDVERRLIWGGRINILVGLTLPFTIMVLSAQAGAFIDPAIFASYQTLVWGVALWAFLPATLVIRGAALIKVGWLVKKARRF